MRFFPFRARSADRAIADLLDRCLLRIECGEATVEACLAEHPQEAAQLRPLLLTAVATRTFLQAAPPPAVQSRLRARVLAAAAPGPMPVARRPLWQPSLVAGLALILLGVLALPVSMLNSQAAVPGDWDYGMKRAGERVRLVLTVDDQNRRTIHLALAERREQEIQALLRQNRINDLSAAVRGLQLELVPVTESLLNGSVLSLSEQRRIAETSARQEAVLAQLEQVVQQEQAPPAVRATVQEARSTAAATRNAAIQAVEQSDPQLAAQLSQPLPPPPVATPAPNARQVAPSPTRPVTVTAPRTPSPSPAAAASESSERDPSPTPAASPSPSVSPSPSASPAPSPSPAATPSASPGLSPSPTPLPSPTPGGVGQPGASPTPLATPTPAAVAVTRTPEPTPASTVPAAARTPAASPAPSSTTLPAQPQAVATATPIPVLPLLPTPTPSSRVSVEVSAPTVTPSPATPTPAPRPVTPSPTPAPIIAPRGAPSPSPSPSPPPASLAPIRLLPGVRDFIYWGPPEQLLKVLSPIEGKYAGVVYQNPGSVPISYQPGAVGDHLILLPGSRVQVFMHTEGTLSLPSR